MSESSSTPSRKSSRFGGLAQALRGGRHDYTLDSPRRALLLLAVPMVLETLMESLFAVVQIFWVARLGREAIVVVGLTESVMTVIYAVAVGISFAATAIVARRIGENDSERAARSAAQIIVLSLATAAAIGLVLGYFATDVLTLMGASASVVEMGSGFAGIMFGGNATVFMIFVINAIFRGAGDAVLAMRTLCLANALNIALSPCLIMGWGPCPDMGMAGAALATNIGRASGVLYQLWVSAPSSTACRYRD